MMLYTKDISNHAIDSAVFDLADDGKDNEVLAVTEEVDISESILSMAMSSTGAESIIDANYHVRYSTVIAWGVEQDSEDSD